MGCSYSNVKDDTKKKFKNYPGLLDKSLQDNYDKDEIVNVNSNKKKLQKLEKICEFNENVELRDICFVESSFYNFFQKIEENKVLKNLILCNVEFDGK